jgi:hypothetical protein
MPYSQSSDPHHGRISEVSGAGGQALRVTPSDAADLPVYPKGLRVFVPQGVPEAAVVVTPMRAPLDTDTVTLRFMPGVSYEPLRVRRVLAAGTTAGIDIHGILD